MKRVHLSLGSNLGDRTANIREALELLAEKGVALLRRSSFYRTEPVAVFYTHVRAHET